jgi:hypothetical protein
MKLSFSRLAGAAVVAGAALFCTPAARAAEWAYTGYYPWIYVYDTQQWVWLPNQPQLVWDNSASGWAANPLASSSVDIRDLMTQESLQINLVPVQESVALTDSAMALVINIQDVENGSISSKVYSSAGTLTTYKLFCKVMTEHSSASVVIHGEYIGATSSGLGNLCFTLMLDFTSANGGTFRLVGTRPTDGNVFEIYGNPIADIRGVFSTDSAN